MTPSSIPALPLFGAALLALSLSAPVQAQTTVIDLGAASGYSALIFGNVGSSTATGFHDVEGRLAAGGNVYLSGFSVGQKSTAGASAPSIVAGGNLAIGTGAIYNGGALGKAVYGVSNPGATVSTNQWFEAGTFSKGSASTLDFAAAKQQLTTLSNEVAKLAPTGTVIMQNSGYTLVGDINADNRLDVRVVTELAWHGLFIRHLLRRPAAEELARAVLDRADDQGVEGHDVRHREEGDEAATDLGGDRRATLGDLEEAVDSTPRRRRRGGGGSHGRIFPRGRTFMRRSPT